MMATSSPQSSIASQLADAFGPALRLNVPLAPYTTIRIGGPAEFFLEATDIEQIIIAREICSRLGIRFTFLAGCSNVVIADEGLPGLVVINNTQQIEWRSNHTVLVDGGYDLDTFIAEASQRGWGDLTFSAGIPGSLGGGIVGGAGAFGHLIYEYLIQAEMLRANGEIVSMTAEDLGITYRDSYARQRGDILLRAEMGPFTETEPQLLLQEIQRIKELRDSKHPGWDLPSAGSFFKNLPPQEPGGRRIPAGKYLDEVGAKGLQVGGAQVFEKHANIIVNRGGATAADVDALANRMAAMVKAKFDIDLTREVLYLS